MELLNTHEIMDIALRVGNVFHGKKTPIGVRATFVVSTGGFVLCLNVNFMFDSMFYIL